MLHEIKDKYHRTSLMCVTYFQKKTEKLLETAEYHGCQGLGDGGHGEMTVKRYKLVTLGHALGSDIHNEQY